MQTSKSLKLYEEDHWKNIFMKPGIVPGDIIPKEMVAMKVDIGISLEKVKYMAR